MRQPEGAQPQRPGRPRVLASGRPEQWRSQRRPRGERGRDASHPAPTEQPSLQCHPQPGGRWLAPGVRDTRAIVSDPRPRPIGGRGGLPHARRGAQRAGPGRSARSSCGARSHREKLLRGAEAVGGGRRRWVGEAIALLSPKSKVLGAVSRARRRGSVCRLPRASLRLCGEPRHRAPA